MREKRREMKEVCSKAFDSCKNCVVECEAPKVTEKSKKETTDEKTNESVTNFENL